MARRTQARSVLLALCLAACGGGGGSDPAPAPPQAATTAPAAASPCGVKPLTFAAERWQAAADQPGGGGVLWEQAYTFTNPNAAPVRLTSLFVVLDVNDTGGHRLKKARSTFRPASDELIPAGQSQERFAQAWLTPGNTPTTDGLYAVTSATVGGSDCPVPVERFTLGPPSAALQALPPCDLQAAAPC